MLYYIKNYQVFLLIVFFFLSFANAEEVLNWEAVNVRIYVHRLSDSNGNFGKSMTSINTNMAHLADVYSEYGIYIQWLNPENIDEIMDDAYATPTPDFDNLFQENVQPNAVNIYFGTTHAPISGLLGWADGIPAVKLWVNGNSHQNVLVHEMGHCFWLYHTYDSRSLEYEYYLPEDEWGNPMYWLSCTEYQFGNNPVENPPELIATNFMSASPHSCKSSFSPDQINRMRYRLENNSFYYDVASEMIGVACKNSTLNSSDNLGGYLGLDDYTTVSSVYDYPSIASGSSKFVVKGNSHSVKTNEPVRNGKKHIQWLNDQGKYLLLNNNFIMLEEQTIPAYFSIQTQTTIYRYLSTIDQNIEGSVELHDPWFVDAQGNQPDHFVNQNW